MRYTIYYADALIMLNNYAGALASAINDFDEALKYGNEYRAEILSYKGSCYFHLADHTKCLNLLYESNKLKDSLANNYIYLGLCNYENGNSKTAEMYLEKAISFSADSEVPYLYLAKINYENGIYDKAISYAASALSFLPSIDECHGIQGDCYKIKDMYVEAITCYSRAIKQNPKADYFQSRALCYYNKPVSEFKKANDDILKALALNDTDFNQGIFMMKLPSRIILKI